MSTDPRNVVSFSSSRSPRASDENRALLGADARSQRLLAEIERVAPSEASVLICGESGVGKELVARQIHALSARRDGPFVALNCGALASSLAEAELFGHEAGAYTGANGSRAGWFENARGGTLFLDEIGDLPLALQVKILRVLQEREVVRVGSRRPLPVDIRLVAATNIDLAEAVAHKRFRSDLYYRLNVASISVPALRERPVDILPLAEHFVAAYSERMKRAAPRLLPDAQAALRAYDWPGNIRELENLIHVALLVCTDGVIRVRDLRFSDRALPAQSRAPATADHADSQPSGARELSDLLAPLDRLFRAPPAQLFPRLEELIVRRALAYCDGNQVQSARLLGISRNVLRTQLKRFGLVSPRAQCARPSASSEQTVPAG